MKGNQHISRKSIEDFVYLLIAQTGLSQEQANTTIETIITYFRQHPGTDPLSRLMAFFFGDSLENQEPSLN